MAEYWAETTLAKATQEIQAAKAAIGRVIHRPVLRRPNTKDIIRDLALSPQQLPNDARERIMAMLTERYGAQAQNVADYIVGESPDEPY